MSSVQTTPPEDVIPAPARAMLALFDAELCDVRFPDIDRDVLRELADAVVKEHAKVDEAQAALARAKEKLDEARDKLSQRTERALAYARIFAADDAALSARLGEVRLGSSLATSVASETPKRRGRPRKQDVTLFAAEEATPAADEAAAE